jgi:hypothetical protein
LDGAQFEYDFLFEARAAKSERKWTNQNNHLHHIFIASPKPFFLMVVVPKSKAIYISEKIIFNHETSHTEIGDVCWFITIARVKYKIYFITEICFFHFLTMTSQLLSPTRKN